MLLLLLVLLLLLLLLLSIIIIIIKSNTPESTKSKNYRTQQFWALDSTVGSATVTVRNIKHG